ncbi:AraC family transcriptional regulator [Chryseobacterium sp. 2987]|uniref:helix-turn-helix domain-containing protein n=1 Tax=Chryseobacterium sp. 2987 TaxID=2817767 RepID=UPI00285F6A0D|nr:AraC family transcriptional regulator [Chryseobacterium sp. 2987]MDR6920204.1 AraC-like DNA-binding protein [Chryseobacterium sp. 2987]
MDEQENTLQTLSYSDIFLSCFSESGTHCVHSKPEHVLIYIYSGEQLIVDRNKKITIKAGECAFIRRDHRLTMYKNSKGKELYKGISLVFQRNVLREFYSKMDKSEIPKDLKISDKTVFKLKPTPAIESLFQSLTPYFDSNAKPTEGVAHLKLLEGIYALLNNNELLYPILFDFAEPWKIDLLEFMNDNYMDDLTMEQISSFTGRSLATFKRDFKKISNLTPQKWLIKKRLEMAYVKLKEENKKVKDVCTEVGFKNLSHFSTAFKKQYGIPPNEIHN